MHTKYKWHPTQSYYEAPRNAKLINLQIRRTIIKGPNTPEVNKTIVTNLCNIYGTCTLLFLEDMDSYIEIKGNKKDLCKQGYIQNHSCLTEV